MKRKLSRQALRTRRLIEEAIVVLIQEQDYSTLRVEDITERADVGRATFYLHYKNKDDLLISILDKYYLEFKELVDRNSTSQGLLGFKKTLEHAKQNPSFLKVMLNHKPTTERMRRLMVTQIKEQFQLIEGLQPGQIEISSQFVAGALIGILRWWLNNLETESIEEVSILVQKMIAQGLSASISNLPDRPNS